MSDTQELGNEGEQQGLAFLKKKGYLLLARNFRTRYGEIDLVTRDGDDLVFVEIKLRGSASFGMPFEAVTAAKQGRIVRAALQYVKEHRLRRENMRFDVVSIGPEPGRIELIKAAFTPRNAYTY
ncbi:MAG: YraN family protein [Endomicrobiales bacterium]